MIPLPWSPLADHWLVLVMVDVLDMVPQRALGEKLHITAELGATHILASHLKEIICSYDFQRVKFLSKLSQAKI